jgi:protein DGCR14
LKKTRYSWLKQYIDGISKIVKRDFFPDLDKLKKQNEFLDALNGNNVTEAHKIKFELSKMTQMEVSVVASDHKPSSSMNTDMSLDSFQQKYTSEDNASFQQIVEKQNEINRKRHRSLYEGEHKKAIAQKELLMLETSPHMSKEGPDWAFKVVAYNLRLRMH